VKILASEKPKFSIIIPCYNQGIFLEDCLDSILKQKVANWEVILVNDGSNDHTSALGECYSEKDSRIHYEYQNNQGLSAARNRGLRNAKGEFLLFLDADDWLYQDCLYKFTLAIADNIDYDLFRCGYAYSNQPKDRYHHVHLPQGACEIWPDVLARNIGPCHSILIRKSVACTLGNFDSSLKSCEDWDFWIRAGKMGARIYSIPDVLVGYRYVANSMSRNPQIMYKALNEVSHRAKNIDYRLPKCATYNFGSDFDFVASIKDHFFRCLGVMIHQGQVDKAIYWYQEEVQKWNWSINRSDWKLLSSYLSWGYFFEKDEIQKLMKQTGNALLEFFLRLGYSKKESMKLVRLVFTPQLKKRNHIRFGRLFGGLMNKLSLY